MHPIGTVHIHMRASFKQKSTQSPTKPVMLHCVAASSNNTLLMPRKGKKIVRTGRIACCIGATHLIQPVVRGLNMKERAQFFQKAKDRSNCAVRLQHLCNCPDKP